MRNLGHRDRTVAAVICAVALVAQMGCALESEEPSPPRPAGDLPMTENEYVELMAALNVALEEGLVGDDAVARARNLGAKVFTREEIEQFVDHLKERPAEWTRIERRVHERTRELRASGTGPP